MGSNTSLHSLFFNFRNPLLVKAVPNLAVLVENTQSNMSTPKQEQTTTSTGYPTPIRYRGLSFGSTSVHYATVLQKSSLSSPPANPPIANPLASFWIKASSDFFLKTGSMPPWTIGNRFYMSGFEWAEMSLSSHLIVRSQASSILGPVVVVLTTSSKAMMMSAPI